MLFSPNTPEVVKLMEQVAEKLGIGNANFSAVEDEEAIIKAYEEDFESVYMGIVFESTDKKGVR